MAKTTQFNESSFSPTRVKNLLASIFINQKKVTQGFFNIEANTSETKEFRFNLASIGFEQEV